MGEESRRLPNRRRAKPTSASGDVAKAKTPGLLESSVQVSRSLCLGSYTYPFSYRPLGSQQAVRALNR
jgi:hypothetical protein